MTLYKGDQYSYNVEIYGQGEAIVLLHGFTGSIETWKYIAYKLSKSYQVIAIDLIGHGKSPISRFSNDYRVGNIAQELVVLILKMAKDPVHLLGYSMGGRIALFLGIYYGVVTKSLILESASPGLATQAERDERSKRDKELADKIEQNGMKWFVDYWEKLPLWKSQSKLSSDILQAQREQRLQNSPLGLANSLRGTGTGIQPNLWDELKKLKMPVQLIVGEEDSKFVTINQQMHQQIPDSQLAIIPNAGHTVHLEQPDQFSQVVSNFLSN